MIVTIIFGVLSVLVIIGTTLYMNKNKAKMKQKKKIKKEKKDIKNIWNIDEVIDNVIVSGTKKSIIMKIGSIDYHLLSNKEQTALETNLIELTKTIKFPVQFFSTTEFIDTTKIIAQIKENSNQTENDNLKEYANKISNYLYKIMDNRKVFVRMNYVILSTYGEYEKARTDLIQSYENIRFNLLNSNISLDILSDIEILELLHRELNKNTTLKIENVLKEGGLDTYVKKQRRGKNKRSKT